MRDVEGLTQAMAWALDHPEEANMMGRGRERMASYKLQHILELHEALYSQAMEELNYTVSSK